jgi:PAS domain S-box-containing protein
MRILIVEDSRLVRSFLDSWAEKHGHQAVAVADAEEALVRLNTARFEMIFVDVTLPGLDGIELVRRIRGGAGGDYAHIVMVTSSEDPAVWARALEVGADDLLTKGVGEAALEVRLTISERQALGRVGRADAEAALRRSEQGFRHVLDIVPQLFFAKDEEGRYVLANRAFAEAYGTTPEEMIGKHETDYVEAEKAKRYRETDLEVLESGVVTDLGEDELIDCEGNRRYVDVIKIPFHRAGSRKAAVLGIATDITDRKHAEEVSRRAAKTAALAGIVAGMAHEIRNPLFGLTASLDAYEARFAPKDGSHAEQFARMRTLLARVSELVQDLLDYGKPHKPRLEPGSLAEVVEEAAESRRELAARRRIEIRAHVSETPPVRMERRRAIHVFTNVIANAIEHSPDGTEVKVELMEAADGAFVECRVRDSGPGFSPTMLPSLFDPFVTQRRGGIGLGLAIAQRIVEEHGGTIAARNADEGGGLVTIRFPVSRDQASADPHSE